MTVTHRVSDPEHEALSRAGSGTDCGEHPLTLQMSGHEAPTDYVASSNVAVAPRGAPGKFGSRSRLQWMNTSRTG